MSFHHTIQTTGALILPTAFKMWFTVALVTSHLVYDGSVVDLLLTSSMTECSLLLPGAAL